MPVRRLALLSAVSVLVALLGLHFLLPSSTSAYAGPQAATGEYRVLEPIQSGGLTLFPVVRNGNSDAGEKWNYLTLDEGLRSGEVVVTEYGKAAGMVRRRHGGMRPTDDVFPRDRVNTLVLINNSDRPLILLAGEIVTGGKQDRVIGKDRIVPAQSDPIDLSVFCIEHGRWVQSSETFGAAGHTNAFMVQPSVRSKALVKQDQQQVWDSVSRSVNGVAKAAAPTASPVPLSLGTTSYAKALGDSRVEVQVDSVADPLTGSKREILQRLKEEHAIGVVAAVHGEIVWADLFATPDMLAAYWTKLVRSYAAESFDDMRRGHEVTVEEAQRFVDRPARGTETSEGLIGVYRFREIRGATQSTFVLQVLLDGADFNAHISRVAEENGYGKAIPAVEFLPRPQD